MKPVRFWLPALVFSLCFPAVGEPRRERQLYFPGMEPPSFCEKHFAVLAVGAGAAGLATLGGLGLTAAAIVNERRAAARAAAQAAAAEEAYVPEPIDPEVLAANQRYEDNYQAKKRGKEIYRKPVKDFSNAEEWRKALPDILTYIASDQDTPFESHLLLNARSFMDIIQEKGGDPGFQKQLSHAGNKDWPIYSQLNIQVGDKRVVDFLADLLVESSAFGPGKSDQPTTELMLTEIYNERSDQQREARVAKRVAQWKADERVNDISGTPRRASMLEFPSFNGNDQDFNEVGYLVRRRFEKQPGGVERLRAKLKEWTAKNPVAKDFMELSEVPVEDETKFREFLGSPDTNHRRRSEKDPSIHSPALKNLKAMDKLLTDISRREATNLQARANWIEAQTSAGQ